MKPMIDQAFWSDPDIEGSKAGVKLSALWMITNSQTSLLGICGASNARFEFETGLKIDALESALKALPRAFKRFGSVIFVRNYIRHQFGTGEKLKRNNFFVALKSLFLSVKDQELKDFIIAEYPEFNEALQRASEGLTKPQYSKVKDGKGSAEGKTKSRSKPSELPELPPALVAVVGMPEKWEEFVQHRREIRKKLTPLAACGLFKTLGERPADALRALDTAIRRSWQGFEWDWLENDRQNGTNGHAPTPPPVDYTEEWKDWLKSNGHEFREYQFAPDFLKSDFHKARKAAKI